MHIGDRIRQKRKELGLTQGDLARQFGITNVSVSEWERGLGKPDQDKLPELARRLRTSVSYLLTGREEGAVRQPRIMTVKEAEDTDDIGIMRLPYYEAKASCGNGVITFESGPKGYLIKESTFFTKYGVGPEDIIAVYAEGNSNADFIVEGDIALFDRRKTEPRSGKLFLIDHPDGLRIKQLRRLVDGTWVLESRNPDKRQYPDELLQPSQAESLRILGEFFYRQGG